MQHNILKQRWGELFQTQNKQSAYEAFDAISLMYGETHRYYHTMAHITDCLALLALVKHDIDALQEVEWALWFHDVVYDPTRNDNEEQSAHYAAGVLSNLGVSADDVEHIKHLINMTKHPVTPTTNDEKYLIDIDLAILGANRERYETYSIAIKKEYAHVPDSQYSLGRKNILHAFLASSRLYHTGYFRDLFEEQARRNIKSELKRL